jgi:hypothetical protein
MGAPALAPQRAPARRRAPVAAPRRRKPRPNSALASRSARAGGARQGVAQPALAGAALIPHAAVRTAGAVRDLSDSGLIVRLTAGRGWIAVLCALLGGIVALNVVSLTISATSGRVSQAIDEYERQNSSLRGDLAEQLSAGKVEDAAATLGLAVPAPEDVTYLDSHDSDLERLANALGGDNPLSTTSPSSGASYSGASSTSGPSTPSYSSTAPSAASTPSAPSAPASSPAPSTTPAPSGGGSSGGGATGGVGL